VSLTSHLANTSSPIGQFIKQRFAHTGMLTKEPNRQLKNVQTFRPILQAGEQYPYGLLGMVIDYRIRYAFGITPYQKLVAWQGAMKLIVKAWESDNDIPFDWENIPVRFPLPADASGNFLKLAEGPYPFKLVQEFFAGLDTTVQALQPVGRLLEPEAERTLDRYCVVLSYFEQVFRSSAYLQGPLMQPTVKQSIVELLSIPQDAWLNDMSELVSLFFDRYHYLLSRPRVLNPTFAGSLDIGGADADLVVDGCLIDIKTTISPQIKADYLYQLAGYLLLDYNDALQINSVGIYLARQGILFAWPVADFLQELTGEDVSLAKLRREFQVLCQRS
jgi:hypothetical protein